MKRLGPEAPPWLTTKTDVGVETVPVGGAGVEVAVGGGRAAVPALARDAPRAQARCALRHITRAPHLAPADVTSAVCISVHPLSVRVPLTRSGLAPSQHGQGDGHRVVRGGHGR